MQNISLMLDDEMMNMLNQLKEHYDKETSLAVGYEELIKELIVTHYYEEVKKQ